MLEKFAPYWKAIVAFLAPGLVALGAAVQAGSPGDEFVTAAEWIAIAIAMFTTAGLVYAAPNASQPVVPEDAPEDGAEPGEA